MEDKSKNVVSNEKKWDRRAENFERKWFNRVNFFQFLQKRVIKLLDLHEGQHFLDMGCGTGWAVRYAANLVENKGEFYGIDISPKMIDKALLYSGKSENIHFYNTNAETLPFQNDFIDVIICTNSFHHYVNPDKVLAEAQRVLKPGGKLYIPDATAEGLSSD